jgi:hypothetical protein
MKIKETIERDCCERGKDLRPVEGSSKTGAEWNVLFCVHCGKRWHLEAFIDAAGDRDTRYVPERPPMVIGVADAAQPVHGKTCPKVRHFGSGDLHDEDDDTPYDVDGVRYCGRCHVAL